MCIKRENRSEVLIYNGINNYAFQAILKRTAVRYLYNFFQIRHIYVVSGKADLQKGIDGFVNFIQREYTLYFYKESILARHRKK